MQKYFKFTVKLVSLFKSAIFSIALLLLLSQNSQSKDGDTLKVRTIDFLAPRTAWFDFPTDPSKFEKIYLNYKLRCFPGKPCGEWDYLAYIFIRNYYAPNFRIEKKVIQSFSYSNNITYKYTYTYDKNSNTLNLDSTLNNAVLLELFQDDSLPTKITDSSRVFPASFRYFINNGKVDSVLTGNEKTLNLEKKRVYFDDDVTFYETIELHRYITPYGNGLNLGDGFTWVMEVSDFAENLKGRVFLDAQNAQEDLELTFDFIEGTPAREVKRLIPLWEKHVTYNGDFDKNIPAIDIHLNEEETDAKLKLTQTGHGFGGNNDNCAEFCRKEGYVKFNGEKKYSQYVWRECGDNPLFPQGGTWLIDRTNWCPGADVAPYNFELTDFITNSKQFSVDWDMEYYNTSFTTGSNEIPYWVINGYLITYGPKKFNNNAEVFDIIRPSEKQVYQRLNPICSNPTIVIRNSGKNNLKSLTIKYGDKAGALSEYNWTGDLKFGDTTWIILPPFEYSKATNPLTNEFIVELLNPNGVADEYPANDFGYSKYKPTPEYYNKISLELNTNNYDIFGSSSPYRYWIKNSSGEIVYELLQTENRKKYTKDLNLPDDCYELTIENTQGYGFYFWVMARNNDGSSNGFYPATFKLLNDGVLNTVNFNPDFGNRIIHQFSVSSQPTIISNPDTLNFWKVKVGESVTKSVYVKPANNKGIKITKVELLLASFKGYDEVKTNPEIPQEGLFLQENDSLEIIVTFRPKSNGNKITNISVSSNDKIYPNKTIPVLGIGADITSVEDDSDNSINVNDLSSLSILSQDNGSVEITYSLNSNNPISNLLVYNVLGDLLFTQNVSSNNTSIKVDTSNLTNGIYFISLENTNKVVKFIINK